MRVQRALDRCLRERWIDRSVIRHRGRDAAAAMPGWTLLAAVVHQPRDRLVQLLGVVLRDRERRPKGGAVSGVKNIARRTLARSDAGDCPGSEVVVDVATTTPKNLGQSCLRANVLNHRNSPPPSR